jgi:hypothetical protein
MNTLQEFLKQRADHIRDTLPERVRVQNEWIQAVERLINQVKEWLTAADPQHILEFFEDTIQRRESDVGVYLVKRLVIRLEAQEVQVVPIARNVIGPVTTSGSAHTGRSYGRVDLTNGVSKFLLFRTQVEPSDRWIIVDEDAYIPRDLDRDTFDAAMQSLLQ